MLFWIIFLPLLILWSISKGTVVGAIGSIIGLIQRFLDLVVVEKVSHKRYPLRNLKRYFAAHKYTFRKNLDDLKVIEKQFENGTYSHPSILITWMTYIVYVLVFSPFYIVYGVFYQGPKSTFEDGIKCWNQIILKRSMYDEKR